jgi:GNAT superfamily N-acetyltransferase
MQLHNIVYSEDPSALQSQQLTGFFVGWPNPPSAETLLKILQRSAHVVFALDTVPNRVVGFINCISDGVLSAYVPLLEVLPEYQKQGIGKQLVQRLLTHTKNYYMVDVVCNPSLLPFYEQFGFSRGSAAIRRDYTQQSGAIAR